MHSRDGLPARAASFHYQTKCLPPKQDRSIKRVNRVMTGPKLSSLDQQQSNKLTGSVHNKLTGSVHNNL